MSYVDHYLRVYYNLTPARKIRTIVMQLCGKVEDLWAKTIPNVHLISRL